jgi:hypothetical protein
MSRQFFVVGIHAQAAGRWGMSDIDYDRDIRECKSKEFAAAVNRLSMENGSNTPDWIIGDFLAAVLTAFDSAVNSREKWYGRANVLSITETLPTQVSRLSAENERLRSEVERLRLENDRLKKDLKSLWAN